MLEAWVLCMALNIYFEAAGEPIDGQFMVAMSVWNRAKGDKNKLCDEIYKPHQYSWTAKRPPIPKDEDKAFQHAVKVARLSEYMGDFTDGVDHYHTFQVSPNWARDPKLQILGSYGNHIIYRTRERKPAK